MRTPKQQADGIRRQLITIEKELTSGDITIGDAFGRVTGLVTIAAMHLECTDPIAALEPIVQEMEKI